MEIDGSKISDEMEARRRIKAINRFDNRIRQQGRVQELYYGVVPMTWSEIAKELGLSENMARKRLIEAERAIQKPQGLTRLELLHLGKDQV